MLFIILHLTNSLQLQKKKKKLIEYEINKN